MPTQLQPEYMSIAGAAAIPAATVGGRAAGGVPVIDARASRPHEILALAERLPPPSREVLPWLRAVAVVAPQGSDELALQLARVGVVAVEGAPDQALEGAIAGVFAELEQVAGMAQTDAPQYGAGSPAAPGGPGGSGATAYSQSPAYFDAATYRAWLDRIEQPWRDEDARDSDV